MPLLSLMGSRWMSSFSGSVCKRLGTFSYFSITLSCFRFLTWTGSLENTRQTKWTIHVIRQELCLTIWIKCLPLTQARVLFHLSFLPFCAPSQQSRAGLRPIKPPHKAVLPWRTPPATSRTRILSQGKQSRAFLNMSHILSLPLSWPSRGGLTRVWQWVGQWTFLSALLHGCFYHHYYHFSTLCTGTACVTHLSPMTMAITSMVCHPFTGMLLSYTKVYKGASI